MIHLSFVRPPAAVARLPRARRRVLCLLGLALAGPMMAAVTPDGTVKKWPASPEKHTVVITRKPTDETSRRLVAAAEASQPPRSDVTKAAGELKLPEKGALWWYKEELGVRLPYAVTGDAVTYYADLVKKYGRQEFERYVEPTSRLEYTASVDRHDSFVRDGETFMKVQVVTLKLQFRQSFCATGTEALAFEKERVVVFDPAGKVLRIFGDGPIEAPVMAI